MLLRDTPLVDARYLVALGAAYGSVPRCQDMPTDALLGPEDAWRLRCWDLSSSLPVLVLSYPVRLVACRRTYAAARPSGGFLPLTRALCSRPVRCLSQWLDAKHPDRKGELLRRLVPILKVMLVKACSFSEHATIGVFWDYCCVPQAPFAGQVERTQVDRGLASMHAWYSHPHTTVLHVATPPAAAGGTRPSESRGWLYVERRLSSLVKYPLGLWELGQYRGGLLYGDLVKEMRTRRRPHESPERVARAIRDGVRDGTLTFAVATDVERVIGLYARGFVHAFETYAGLAGGFLECSRLGWGAAEAPALAEALAYAEAHCDASRMSGRVTLSFFHGNQFDRAHEEALRATVAGSTKFSLYGSSRSCPTQGRPVDHAQHSKTSLASTIAPDPAVGGAMGLVSAVATMWATWRGGANDEGVAEGGGEAADGNCAPADATTESAQNIGLVLIGDHEEEEDDDDLVFV